MSVFEEHVESNRDPKGLVLFPDLCCSQKYSRILVLSELKERHKNSTRVDPGNWGGERALCAKAF